MSKYYKGMKLVRPTFRQIQRLVEGCQAEWSKLTPIEQEACLEEFTMAQYLKDYMHNCGLNYNLTDSELYELATEIN